MELLEGMMTRSSVRGFKATPVPKQTIERILEAAGRSPSYSNTQPWEVAVVTGRKRDDLSKILYDLADADTPSAADLPHPKTWPEALATRAREHGARRFKALGIEREDTAQRKEMRLRNFRFYGAPVALFLFIDKSLSNWSIFDAGAFANAITLAAHSFGLGTCLQGSVVEYTEAIRKCLGIPETKLVVLAISLGYTDLSAPLNQYHSTRVGLNEFVKWYE